MATHTHVREFRCPHCGKEYAYSGDLSRHVNSCTAKVTHSDVAVVMAMPPVPSNNIGDIMGNALPSGGNMEDVMSNELPPSDGMEDIVSGEDVMISGDQKPD